MEKRTEQDTVTERIIACAIDVHSELGPGLLERPYAIALAIALKDAGLKFEAEKQFPIVFRGKTIGDYRPDFIVEDHAVVEIKSVRVTGKDVGLIINFNRPRLVDGIKRVAL